MTNYTEKETQVVEKISKAMNKLEKDSERIDTLSQGESKHTVKKWFAEKEALHEIRHILHEADRYETYDENEMAQFERYINSIK